MRLLKQQPVVVSVRSNPIPLRHVSKLPRCSQRHRPCTYALYDEMNWDVEMGLLKRRKLQSNQLETLRRREAEVDVGKVVFSAYNLAVIEGLNCDAPIGTKLAFIGGATGVLMWRKTDNICFAILISGADRVTPGEAVECMLSGILQVVDDVHGPTTKRHYQLLKVPTGEALRGRVIDYLGRDLETGEVLRTSAQQPLFNAPVKIEDRGPIHEPLTTGLKAVDILAPLGRGANMVVTGPSSTAHQDVIVDMLLGQRRSGAPCVYAAIGCSREELEKIVTTIRHHSGMQHTTVVAATADRPIAEQFAAICAALSLGEQVRDDGRAALVIVDNFRPVVQLWDKMTALLAEISRGGKQLSLEQPDMPQVVGHSNAALAAEWDIQDVERMLRSTLAETSLTPDSDTTAPNERRRFYSSVLHRAAKLSKRFGGGSMTLVCSLPGKLPSTNKQWRSSHTPVTYSTLSAAQRRKLFAAFANSSVVWSVNNAAAAAEHVPASVLDEFVSIADGQVVLETRRDAHTGGVVVDPTRSFSRLGLRAYPAALKDLAANVRFALLQAADAKLYAVNLNDQSIQRSLTFAQLMQDALAQSPRTSVALSVQVAQLFALQRGFVDSSMQCDVQTQLALIMHYLRMTCRDVLSEIDATGRLTARAAKKLTAALQHYIGTVG